MSDGASEETTSLIRLGELFHGWSFAANSGGPYFKVYDSFLLTLKTGEQEQLAGLIHASEFWRNGTLTADTLAEHEMSALRMMEGKLGAFIRSDACSHDSSLNLAKQQMCIELWGSLRAVLRRHELKRVTGPGRGPPSFSR